MRIVYACGDPGVPLLGGKGASVHMRSVTAALAHRGHQVIIACASIGSGNPKPIVDEIVALDPDPARQEETLTALLGSQSVDAVIERYSLNCGPARRASSRVGVPLVLEVNAPLVLEAARHRGLGDLDRWLAYERDVFVTADAIGVVSRALAAYVRGIDAALDPRWVPNGVDPVPFERAKLWNLGLPEGAVAVGFAGSMKSWHGVADLVEAMCLLEATPAHLVLIGTGPEADRVQTLVADRGLTGRVRLLGSVAHVQIPGLLAALDIGVAPYVATKDFYFSPLKVLEYLAAGLPVVCPSLGDLPELVGDAGVFYDAGDIKSLSASIARLATDSRAREIASSSARAQARRWTWDTNARAYESLIVTPTAGGPSSPSGRIGQTG